MARGGINKLRVQQAREALLGRGDYPSIDAVRVELGNTGSKTTIHRYLKELEDEEGTRLGDEALLSDTLTEMIGRLARRLHEEAAEIVEKAAACQQAALAEREQQLGTLRTERDETKAQLADTEAERDAERAGRAAVVEALTAAKTRIAELTRIQEGLEARLAEKDERIASLEEKHRNARDALEHYRAAVKAQREEDQRNQEREVQGLRAEIHSLKEDLMARREETTRLNRDNARLVAELGDRQKEGRALKSELGSVRGSQSRLTEQQAKLKTHMQNLAKEAKAHRTRIATLEGELKEARGEVLSKDREQTRLLAQVAAQEGLFKELKERLAENLAPREG